MILAELFPYSRLIFTILYGITAVAIIGVVVSENRNPVKTLAWITVLVLLPVVGIVLYIFFGRSLRHVRMISRKKRLKLTNREDIKHLLRSRQVVHYDTLKSERQQMINLVNAISNGLSRDFVEALPGYLLEHSKLRLLQLAKCEGFDQLLTKLKGTPYYKPLLGTVRTEDGRPDFTDAEIRIRTAYYSGLMQSVKSSSFSRSEKEELEALIKSDVDMINIINSLRLKTYFGYNADDIKLFMLPFTGTGKRVMQCIYSSDTPEQMLAKIEHTKYGRAIDEGRDAHDIERSLQQNRLRQMKHTIAGSNSAAVVMYAFMYICDNEIRNLVRIIEGVRYDVEPALIFKLLVV